jgi:hypothetical protein
LLQGYLTHLLQGCLAHLSLLEAGVPPRDFIDYKTSRITDEDPLQKLLFY